MSSESLVEYLRYTGVQGRVLSFDRPTTTVSEAVEALGIDRTRILKSILLVDKNERPVLALVPGHKRVSIPKLEIVSGSQKLRIAREEEVERYTGYKAGALPPIGHSRKIATFADHAVLSSDVIYCGGGSAHKLLEISPIDVIRIGSADLADISE